MSIKRNRRKDLLRQRVEELVAIAKHLSPDFLVFETKPPYEDEDIVLKVVVPKRLEERVQRALSKRRHEIFMDDGLFIGLQVRGVKKSEIIAETTTKQSG
ncbi:MAG: hypothetical protein ACK40X_03470 [Armatimonadota bacterium]